MCELLHFACHVVGPGRAFYEGCLIIVDGIESPHHNVKLVRGVHEDLKIWEQFLLV